MEEPGLPSGITPTVVPFKLLLLGKSALGKTSTVAKLAGKELPTTYCETPGIQTTLIYWPAKVVTSIGWLTLYIHNISQLKASLSTSHQQVMSTSMEQLVTSLMGISDLLLHCPNNFETVLLSQDCHS